MQAVILLVQHNSSGSVGFVLNRPTQFRIGSVTTGLGPFEECCLMWGGDLGKGTVQMIHGFDESVMPGARKVHECSIPVPILCTQTFEVVIQWYT